MSNRRCDRQRTKTMAVEVFRRGQAWVASDGIRRPMSFKKHLLERGLDPEAYLKRATEQRELSQRLGLDKYDRQIAEVEHWLKTTDPTNRSESRPVSTPTPRSAPATLPVTIAGWCMVWNSPGHCAIGRARGLDLYEILLPGAADRALAGSGEISLKLDHAPGKIVARRSDGTLHIGASDYGVHFQAEPYDDAWGREAVAALREAREDGLGMSFTMLPGTACRVDDNFGIAVRKISDLRLDEITISTNATPGKAVYSAARAAITEYFGYSDTPDEELLQRLWRELRYHGESIGRADRDYIKQVVMHGRPCSILEV